MSWAATNWARTQTTGSVGPKAILLLLADLADENHSCFPGQARLAADSEQDVRTVRRHLVHLEQLGLIRREHRYGGHAGRTSDRYHLAVDDPQPLPDKLPANPAAEYRTTGTELPDKSGQNYRTPVSGEQLEEPLEEEGAAEPETAPVPVGGLQLLPKDFPGTAGPPPAGPGWDEFGPTQPYCPDHPPWKPEQPCSRCAEYRKAHPAADAARQRARDKAARAAAAAERAAEDARRAATTAPPESVKRHADQLRKQLRKPGKPPAKDPEPVLGS